MGCITLNPPSPEPHSLTIPSITPGGGRRGGSQGRRRSVGRKSCEGFTAPNSHCSNQSAPNTALCCHLERQPRPSSHLCLFQYQFFPLTVATMVPLHTHTHTHTLIRCTFPACLSHRCVYERRKNKLAARSSCLCGPLAFCVAELCSGLNCSGTHTPRLAAGTGRSEGGDTPQLGR